MYNAYWNLYTQETGLRLAYEAWRIFNARYAGGQGQRRRTSPDCAASRIVRSQRLSALNAVLEQERGDALPCWPAGGEDRHRAWLPPTSPTLAAYTPIGATAVESALP